MRMAAVGPTTKVDPRRLEELDFVDNIAGREPCLTASHCCKLLLKKHLGKIETRARAFSMKPEKHNSGGESSAYTTLWGHANSPEGRVLPIFFGDHSTSRQRTQIRASRPAAPKAKRCQTAPKIGHATVVLKRPGSEVRLGKCPSPPISRSFGVATFLYRADFPNQRLKRIVTELDLKSLNCVSEENAS